MVRDGSVWSQTFRDISENHPGCFKMFKTSGVIRDVKIIRGTSGTSGWYGVVRGGFGVFRNAPVVGSG